MQEVTNFAFEEHLVRSVVIDGEPWFVGADVCRALGLANSRTSLDRLDEDEKGVHTVDTLGGPQTMSVVNEAGVFRLIFTSRKPEAERFKRWLAHDVLPTLRRTGAFGLIERDPRDVMIDDEPIAVVSLKLQMVREARILRGPKHASWLWNALKLPKIPSLEPDLNADAVECLRMMITETVDGRPGMVADLIVAALSEDLEAEAMLMPLGLRTNIKGTPPDMFWVSNNSFHLRQVYHGTRWADGKWALALGRLPGVISGGYAKVNGVSPSGAARGMTATGRFVPSRYLDLAVLDAMAPANANGEDCSDHLNRR